MFIHTMRYTPQIHYRFPHWFQFLDTRSAPKPIIGRLSRVHTRSFTPISRMPFSPHQNPFTIKHFKLVDVSESTMSSTPSSSSHANQGGQSNDWADFFPPQSSPNSSALPDSNADGKTTPPRPRNTLLDRIDKIRKDLEEVSISVENREIIIEAARWNPLYMIRLPKNAAWNQKAQAHNRAYSATTSQVKRIGDKATLAQVIIWEERVKKLLEWTLNQVDKIDAENAWEDFREDPDKVFGEWTWEKAREGGDEKNARGREIEESVDPFDVGQPNLKEDAGKYVDEFLEESLGFR
ncbi:hypothetical protein P154DRAFT_599513 [Amniculicola lignicola CBS 123094]|uniref:Uncharacterized protein n=1 Tax=Amniculicola lignicola CBS 123094 TaxID=1392246 RepID=A0A6A5WGC1_9PLEO|nr:hypothetical protein P154DRAFT_599513 [Amniculicola lignicola CBS 123094]